jgi:hypothetical protein
VKLIKIPKIAGAFTLSEFSKECHFEALLAYEIVFPKTFSLSKLFIFDVHRG